LSKVLRTCPNICNNVCLSTSRFGGLPLPSRCDSVCVLDLPVSSSLSAECAVSKASDGIVCSKPVNGLVGGGALGKEGTSSSSNLASYSLCSCGAVDLPTVRLEKRIGRSDGVAISLPSSDELAANAKFSADMRGVLFAVVVESHAPLARPSDAAGVSTVVASLAFVGARCIAGLRRLPLA